MNSVGEVLKRARLTQGLDVSAVAALTKINPKYLEAIEADDRQQLPSGFFYRSFVHQYALNLGLDPHEVDAEVERVLSADAPLPLPGQESETAKSLPRVRAVNRFQAPRAVTSFAALVLVMVACSGIYAWWHSSHGLLPGEEMKPNTQAAVAHTTAYHPANSTAESAPAKGLEAVPGYKLLVDMIAHEDTWLSVYSDGKKVFAGTLAANQTKTVEGQESARVTVGNAAGIEMRWNGKVLDPIGNRGQVMTVVFKQDKFMIIPQAPKVEESKAGEVGEIFSERP